MDSPAGPVMRQLCLRNEESHFHLAIRNDAEDRLIGGHPFAGLIIDLLDAAGGGTDRGELSDLDLHAVLAACGLPGLCLGLGDVGTTSVRRLLRSDKVGIGFAKASPRLVEVFPCDRGWVVALDALQSRKIALRVFGSRARSCDLRFSLVEVGLGR